MFSLTFESHEHALPFYKSKAEVQAAWVTPISVPWWGCINYYYLIIILYEKHFRTSRQSSCLMVHQANLRLLWHSKLLLKNLTKKFAGENYGIYTIIFACKFSPANFQQFQLYSDIYEYKWNCWKFDVFIPIKLFLRRILICNSEAVRPKLKAVPFLTTWVSLELILWRKRSERLFMYSWSYLWGRVFFKRKVKK